LIKKNKQGQFTDWYGDSLDKKVDWLIICRLVVTSNLLEKKPKAITKIIGKFLDKKFKMRIIDYAL